VAKMYGTVILGKISATDNLFDNRELVALGGNGACIAYGPRQ
jgi:hypothetical protein